MSRTHSGPRPTRWWIVWVVLVLSASGLIFAWVREEPLRQNRYLMTQGILILTVIALLTWAVLLSRWTGRRRLRVFLGALGIGVLFGSLFELRAVTGDFLPIFAFRFRAKDDMLMTRVERPAMPERVSIRAERDFPQFLGPNRDGVVRGYRLERDWESHPPRELWRREAGPSWSTFAVVGDKAITHEQRGDQEAIVCHDLGTGEVLWIHTEEARYASKIAGDGPRATPTIDGGRVYAMGSTGMLLCVELEDGELVWRREVTVDAGDGNPNWIANDWGIASSPLVFEDKVVVTSGGAGGPTLLAYSRDTGAPLWTSGTDRAGYASPSLHTIAGVEQIVSLNNATVTSHDPATGDVLWQVPWNDATESVAQPVQIPGDRLIVAAGYGVGASAFQIERAEDGTLSATTLWEGSRALKAKLSNFVYRDGYVYGFDDGILACVDVDRGRRKWKGGRYGHGQVLLFDDLLLITAESGELVLVEAGPEEHRELARFTALDGKTWNGAVFAPPFLLVRNDLEVVCFEVSLEADAERSALPVPK